MVTRIRPLRRARRSGATSVALVALVGALGLAACNSSGGDTAQGDDTIAPPSSSSGGVEACADVEPGVVVDRSLAVVHFDTEHVCPGWVTVEQGTPITFTNDGGTAHTVVVTATQTPDSEEVARFTVAPGASQPFDTLDQGRLGFSTDALPGFRGTIEVVAPGAGGGH